MITVERNVDNLSATERRIFDLLSDGLLHTREEIASKGIQDELSSRNNVSAHIQNVRKKISYRGLTISFVVSNGRAGRGYQMFRRISRGE